MQSLLGGCSHVHLWKEYYLRTLSYPHMHTDRDLCLTFSKASDSDR
jgi:hypothetical protein